MNILLLNYEFPPLGGGASKATYHMAIELVRLGHTVTVLTSRAANQPSEEMIEGVTVYRVTSWRRGIHDCGVIGAFTYILFALPKLRLLLKRNDYDVLHYFFSLPTGLLTLYSHAIRDRPYILSLRGSDVPDYDPSNQVLQLLHRPLRPLTRYIWRQAECTIALSNAFRQLAWDTAPDQSLDVIYNGIDTQFYKPMARQRSDGTHVRLLCVSRLIKRKGLNYLIDALVMLSEAPIELDIVGTGNFEKSLKAQVEKADLGNRIRFLGFRPPHELRELYNRADIFILPSLAESFGMVLLEAMSCGLPIIASNVGGIPEIVTDGENGILVQHACPNELAGAIERLVNDRLLRQQMTQNNLAKIHAMFEWKSIARQYQNVYERVLA